MDYIKVRGARQHNLKNIDLDIPKNKLVVFTGLSGSGKSSLAFDTIYAEGQRRYVESLSSYARQFLGIMQKPDVDSIDGLSPAISIDQKTTTHNPRSTVGTVTEIYDYLRLLFARIGHPHCPICGREISSQSIDQIVDSSLNLIGSLFENETQTRLMILSPIVKDRKGEFSNLFDNLRSQGFKRVRVDGEIFDTDENFVLIKTNKHTIEVVIDRLSINQKDFRDKLSKENLKERLNDSIEQALKLSDGLVIISHIKDKSFEFPNNPKKFEDHLFSEKFSCPIDNIQLPEIEPRSFSFNTPYGACPKCTGLGVILKVNENALFSEELSILQGGILPFPTIFEHDTWYGRLIRAFCESENIKVDVPIRTLSREEKSKLLEGGGEKLYKVKGKNKFGKTTYIVEKFEGIIKNLQRKYQESDSDYTRWSIEKYMVETLCPECGGTRLKKEALGITISGKSIHDITSMPIEESLRWIKGLNLPNREKEIAKLITREIESRLTFLIDVGLEYLTLARSANTLAGGETQRIRLASQIGSGLTGVLYVLDEPTIGLHQRDNARLILTLKKLRDLGNTVIVVEHDKEMMKAADYIFDFGPAAGKHGGTVVSKGKVTEIIKDQKSVSGKYISGQKKIVVPTIPKTETLNAEDQKLIIRGASQFNLKNIDVEFPLGKFIVVTGVSGSGKSTLVVETLYHAVASRTNPLHKEIGGAYKSIEGVEKINKVILIDQSPIGRTPRSNPATYTKVFDLIRKIYAGTKESRSQGFNAGRFSFNVKGGRCESCEGQGQIKIEMQFMPDIWVTCEVCHGKRYNGQTLDILYKGKNISEVLNMTISEAKEFFHLYSGITSKLETLEEVGLGYIELGQPAPTLSGGEAQRVKLASELSKRGTGNALYILDEPTTGLHFVDLEKLLRVLKLLVSSGNTVIVIEHNLDIIKNADWIIDLGEEGGEKGGRIVATGTPKDIANSNTYTGIALKEYIDLPNK
jgi:excinuclease ABC subunit A